MKTTLNHKLKRIKQKFYIWRKSTFDSTYKGEVDYQQTSAYLICKKLIEKPGAILLMSPLSGKRYIKLDSEEIFVIINSNSIQIINHVYSYTIAIQGRILTKTLDVFDNKMESMRLKMENDIIGNVQNSLNQIKKDLDNNSSKIFTGQIL
jgi:cell wall assembly regulator SMI1